MTVKVLLLSAVSSVCVIAAMSRTSQAATVAYQVTFDSAAGTTNGSSISGVTGGTATIREQYPSYGTVQVQTSPSIFGSGGALVASANGTGAYRYGGARLTPADVSNSLNNGFVAKGGSQDHHNLTLAYDFLFLSSVNVSQTGSSDALRILDAGNTASGQMRMILSNTVGNDLVFAMSVIAGGTPGVSAGTTTTRSAISVNNTTGFEILAGEVVHIGITIATDPTSGDVTARLFGTHGTGAIDTTITTVSTVANPTVLLAQATMPGTVMDTARLSNTAGAEFGHNGFVSGFFEIGMMSGSNTQARTQAFDNFTVYSGTPDSFAAVPEPTGLGIAVLGLAAASARWRQR